jgi:hypothetical protein
MSDPRDEEPKERATPRRRSLVGRLLRGFIILNVLCALASVGFALFVKFTHPSVDEEDSDKLDLVTVFGGLELKSLATSFRGR